jgi:hypothetical protein
LLTVPEIYTYLLAEDTQEKIIILQYFLKHQDVLNASPSQEDLYISPCEDFKSIG